MLKITIVIIDSCHANKHQTRLTERLTQYYGSVHTTACGNIISFHSENLPAGKAAMWKCNFPNLLISDLLSASDKLESLFLGSPFSNRSSGSWLIAFYTLPLWWPVIKKQTNSNCSCEQPRSLWIKYEQSLPCRQAAGLKKWLTSWRCNWRCGQTDRQAAEMGRH